ncbi:MAG: DUF502 domain-containing protein [Haloarculaceae archaeon]
MSAASAEHGQVLRVLRESFLTGVAIVAPALVTFYLLLVAIDFVLRLVRPFARIALLVVVPSVSTFVAELGASAALAGFVFAVGFVAHFHTGERALERLDGVAMRVPLIGSVYKTFRRLSDAMLGDDEESFREVVLVELLASETYMLGFRIAEAHEAVADSADVEDAQTLFVPLAPNPVMAGFLVHVPEDQIHEVDMSVEQGISAIVSLGATEGATDQSSPYAAGASWS